MNANGQKRARLIAFLASALLCFGSLQAPFAHVHAESSPDHQAEHHHASGLMHFHLPGEATHAGDQHSGPAWEASDGDSISVSVDWTPAGSARISFDIAEPRESVGPAPTLVASGLAPEFHIRSHDPPSIRPSFGRAPPL